MNYASCRQAKFLLNNVEDFAFLTQVLPLRGYDYAQQIGTKFAVTNMEFRFPLVEISYLWCAADWFCQYSWLQHSLIWDLRGAMIIHGGHSPKIPMMAR